MALAALEARVSQLVELVLAGGRVEDDSVECKAELGPPEKLARQLAGQANGALGEHVLWIVGLDEDGSGLTTTPADDTAEWWPQVTKRFDGHVAPELEHHVVVPIRDLGAVLALSFTTDRAPYVVSNPSGEGPIDRDVPWREGASTRSAYRSELLRILMPQVDRPDIEIVGGRGSIRLELQKDGGSITTIEPVDADWILVAGMADLFITPPLGQTLVGPSHRLQGSIEVHSDVLPDVPSTIPVDLRWHAAKQAPELGLWEQQDHLYGSGPGSTKVGFDAKFENEGRAIALSVASDLTLRLAIGFAGSDRPVQAAIRFNVARSTDSSAYLELSAG